MAGFSSSHLGYFNSSTTNFTIEATIIPTYHPPKWHSNTNYEVSAQAYNQYLELGDLLSACTTSSLILSNADILEEISRCCVPASRPIQHPAVTTPVFTAETAFIVASKLMHRVVPPEAVSVDLSPSETANEEAISEHHSSSKCSDEEAVSKCPTPSESSDTELISKYNSSPKSVDKEAASNHPSPPESSDTETISKYNSSPKRVEKEAVSKCNSSPKSVDKEAGSKYRSPPESSDKEMDTL